MADKSAALASARSNAAERILVAGRELFFEHGFQKTSTDMLVKKANASKATLYRYYDNMTDVFEAVIAAESEQFLTPVPRQITSRDDLKQELHSYGVTLMKFLNRPQVIKLAGLMNEESRENPEAARRFYDAAYHASLTYLAKLLQDGLEKGLIDRDLASEELAIQLLSMWEFIPMLKVQMRKTKRPFPDPEAWSRKCVDTLLPA